MTHLTAGVVYFAVLFSGIIAGLLFGTAIEQQRLSALDGAGWVTARHSIDAVFSRLLPWVWNSTLLLLFASAYLVHGMGRMLFVIAGVLLLLGIAVTLVFEVPINKQIAAWTPATLPAHWTNLRDRWVRFHWVRTLAGMAAFACALAPLLR